MYTEKRKPLHLVTIIQRNFDVMHRKNKEVLMDIYTYTAFAYGLTAAISLAMTAVIILINKITTRM
jgi:hypothetical protein